MLAPFLGYLWCFTRIFIRALSGRQLFNVLGALHAITHELVTVTNETYINAQSVCDLLWKIARLNLDTPITFILDNARYQRCRVVKNLAAQVNIELVFLPAYSPNLNLIERLWKFVKSNVYIQSTTQSLPVLRVQSLTVCKKPIRIINKNSIHY